MRVLRAVILLILLPGLLVPGGIGFRICLCAAVDACCAADAGEADCCAPATSCCRARPSTERADVPRRGLLADAQPTCACVDVGTPSQPPATAPGPVAVDLAPLLEPTVMRLGWPSPRVVSDAIEARARPPPSAGAPRNKRLLL